MSENIGTKLKTMTTGLFKYLSADKLIFFENRLLLLTPPVFLNDPWDFLPKGRTASENEILKVWREIETEITKASIIHLPVSFAQRQQMERLQQLLNLGKSKEFTEGLAKYSREQISSICGIVSFSENPSCRLMWAHYSESHTGFVAEFAASDHVQEPEEEINFCSCIGYPAGKVKYPLSFKLSPWTSENIVGACWSKHHHWKYEQEWRILWSLNQATPCQISSSKRNVKPQERFCLQFEPASLNRVIFGMRMRTEAQKRLYLMLKDGDFKHVQKEITHIDHETGDLVLKPLP